MGIPDRDRQLFPARSEIDQVVGIALIDIKFVDSRYFTLALSVRVRQSGSEWRARSEGEDCRMFIGGDDAIDRPERLTEPPDGAKHDAAAIHLR